MNRAARCLVITSLLSTLSLAQSQARNPSNASPTPTPTPTPVAIDVSGTASSKIPRPAAPTGTQPTDRDGNLEILSDTMGVDFKPYMKELRKTVQFHWNPLIPTSAMPPELKSGRVVVQFAILRDGKIAGLKITEASGDMSLDRAAFGALSHSSPFAPLPQEFKGNYILMRAHFLYNPDRATSKTEEKSATPSPKQGSEQK